MVSITILLTISKNHAILRLGGNLDKKDDKKSISTAVDLNNYPIPELLREKRPHKNRMTNEIRYYSSYDLYFEEVRHTVFMTDPPFVKSDWILIEETQAIKALYGPGKKEENT